jgi:transcriptional regulator with XRE-family HTH domain
MVNIAHYRKLRGLTQAELADMVGIKQPHISRIEKGDEGPPLSLYRSIAINLGVTLEDLFSEEMTRAEADLISGFRKLPKNLQEGWVLMAKAAVVPPKADQ